MVTNLTATPVGSLTWLLTWSTTLSGIVTFRVYRDGAIVATTTDRSYLLTVAPGQSPVIEVLDDSTTPVTDAFPGYVVLTWRAVAGAADYRVEQFDGTTWQPQATVYDDGSGYMVWQSQILPDGSVTQFRVVPEGTNGNDGTPRAFTVLMVRYPDPPAVAQAYSNTTHLITVSAA